MEKLTQQLQNAFNNTKIKNGDCFDRLATFTKIKSKQSFYFSLRKIFNNY